MLVLSEIETHNEEDIEGEDRMRQLHLSRADAMRTAAALTLWNLERLSAQAIETFELEEAA